MSIPKKIHYCWFGHNEKPELVLKCIESWKKYCPDYEIIEWNEDNIDVNFCSYSKRAYEEKRWGYVPDPLRMKIIFENGGIYLDTDVELVRNLDELLDNAAWFGYGTETEINTGSGFGAEKGNVFIKTIMEHYMNLDENAQFEVCTIQEKNIFKKEFPEFYANKSLEKDQILGDRILILWNIWKYTNHHYTGTWQSPKQRFFNKVTPKFIKRIYFGIKYKIKEKK